MTLEELLDRLDITVTSFDEYDSNQLKYKLQFQYIKRIPYPNDDQESEIENEITELDINTEDRTITFKGK